MKEVCKRCSAVETVTELAERANDLQTLLEMVSLMTWNENLSPMNLRDELRLLLENPDDDTRS